MEKCVPSSVVLAESQVIVWAKWTKKIVHFVCIIELRHFCSFARETTDKVTCYQKVIFFIVLSVHRFAISQLVIFPLGFRDTISGETKLCSLNICQTAHVDTFICLCCSLSGFLKGSLAEKSDNFRKLNLALKQTTPPIYHLLFRSEKNPGNNRCLQQTITIPDFLFDSKSNNHTTFSLIQTHTITLLSL